MIYIHLYTLCLMFVFNISCGQNQTKVPQDNFSKEHKGIFESQAKELANFSVPRSQVRHIKQARNGDMLISSFLGVFRYDGKSFTNLTSKISSPSFWDVLEDRKGNLWFATRDSGVYLQTSGQTTFQHFTTKEGLASNYGATHLYEDKAGNIWFGGGRYDGKSFRMFTTNDGHPNYDVRAIIEGKTGKLWIATVDGPCVYDARPDSIGRKIFALLKDNDGKAFRNVWSIIEDKKGNIWFGASDGLWRYDGSTFTKVSQRGAYGIIEDRKGNIWTTGEINPNGRIWALSFYDQKNLYDKMPTVKEIKTGEFMDFLALFEAKDGSIWFGAAGGVYRYDGKTITDFKETQK